MPARPSAEAGKEPHPVDIHVGSRLRLRRDFLGYSQHRLADALGLTFQQIQKYEKGANRISASKLYELALVLDVGIEFFFEGAELVVPMGRAHPPDPLAGASDSHKTSAVIDSVPQAEVMQLVSAYSRIEDPAVRGEALSLLKVLGPVSLPLNPDDSDPN